MKLSELASGEVDRRLQGAGLVIACGPFKFRITSPLPSVAAGLKCLYGDYPLCSEGDFADFALQLQHGPGLRRWWRQQVRFSYEGIFPFEPLPVAHAFPQLEWAMNWCVSTQAHQYLILHSAVVEREGFAAILAAPPGSGKSTLCAGLISRGWRLLSDELALISLGPDRRITAFGRPVSLKNQSLDVIKKFVPDAVFNEVTHDTSKGSVTHMRVPTAHLQRIHETAQPRWIIFPKYESGAPPTLTPRSKATGLLELGRNAFNYTILGEAGFEALADVIDASDCYDFRYSQLDDAIAVFDGLVEDAISRA